MRTSEIAQLKRDALIDALGGKCSCHGDDCWHTGECTVSDRRCLQIDHINGDGVADRGRLKTVGVVNYYFNHLAEARDKIQVLCANCNWVKRHRNHEHRNGKIIRESPRIATYIASKDSCLARVTSEITGLPDYVPLCADAERFISRMVEETAYTDLVDWVESIGLQIYGRRTVAYYLAKRWEKKKGFGDSREDLAKFLQRVRDDFDSVCRIASMRLGDDRMSERKEGIPNG